MEAFVDINQIDYQDFDTPKTRDRQQHNPHLNLSHLGQSPSHSPSPIIHRRLSQDLSQNQHPQINQNQPGESKRTTKIRSITDKWLRSFSLSRNLSEDEQNASLLANLPHEQNSQEINLEQNSLVKKYSTLGVTSNMSPLGIPFQPFAHTRTNFHARARSTLGGETQSQNAILNHSSSNHVNFLEGNNTLLGDEQQQYAMQNDGAGLRKYDEKIRDVSDTLAKLREYKTQLTAIEQQQKFRTQKKRAKSSMSNCSPTNSNYSGTSRRLPLINQQPMMYFSPFEPAHSQQSQSTKKRKTKKPKQAGINELARNILSGLPQEKLANLMAVNMYNKALLKKEENEDKITTVISEQNKLLAKMLDQYDKRVHDTRKQIKLNLGRLQADSIQESRFERDKRNFEKVYSDIQQSMTKRTCIFHFDRCFYFRIFYCRKKLRFQPLFLAGFTREQATLDRIPRNDDTSPVKSDRNTKQLRYIPSHYKKYKPVPETKVQQPPMIF